jgi:hypothetical protein
MLSPRIGNGTPLVSGIGCQTEEAINQTLSNISNPKFPGNTDPGRERTIALNFKTALAYYHRPNLCRFENICDGVFPGGYSVYLLGDSSKCRGIKIVSGIIHNSYTDKLVAVNNLLITYLGQGNVFTFHSVEI